MTIKDPTIPQVQQTIKPISMICPFQLMRVEELQGSRKTFEKLNSGINVILCYVGFQDRKPSSAACLFSIPHVPYHQGLGLIYHEGPLWDSKGCALTAEWFDRLVHAQSSQHPHAHDQGHIQLHW